MTHSLVFLLVFAVAGVMCGLIVARLIHFERMGEVGQIVRVARASRFRVVRISPEMGALVVVTVLPLFGLQYGLNNKADKLDSHFSYELGKSAVVEGRLADALGAFQEAGRLNPRDERVYTSIGVVYFMMAEREPYGSPTFMQLHKKAVESQMKALSLNPKYARAYSNLGMSLYQLGRKKEAIDAEKQAIELKPDTEEAYYNLACMYALEGLSEDALRSLEQAIDRGYENLEEMSKDATLGAIRDTPKFRELQERIRQKHQPARSALRTPTK